MHQIETARLLLRPLREQDADALHCLWTHPDVRRYLWDGAVIPVEQTKAVIRDSLSCFEQHGFGLWAVCLKGQAAFIGFCGYWFFDEPLGLQLLYGIAPQLWGQGLATECAQAMIRYGFEVLDFEQIVASADVPNAASLRVMEKVGLKFTQQLGVRGRETVLYGLSRAAFRAERTLFTYG